MTLHSINFGRGIVLLILGIAIGTGLFLQSRLSPETLRDQVVAALNEMFAIPVELDEEQVEIQLKHGLVIHNLVIPYPKGAGPPGDAIRAEKIDITIDQKKLLSGEVVVTHVHVHGLTLLLRRDATKGGVPGLPDILKAQDDAGPGDGPPPPRVQILPGEHGSWIVLEDLGPSGADDGYPQILSTGRRLKLKCKNATFRQTTEEQRLTVHLEDGRLGSGEVVVSRPSDGGNAFVDVKLRNLSLKRSDFVALAEELRGHMPPVRASGRADLVGHVEFSNDWSEMHTCVVKGRLHRIEGGFGNFFTGEPHGYRFKFRNGSADIDVQWPQMRIRNFQSEYLNSTGEVGTIAADLVLDASAGWHFPRVGFELHARDMRAIEFDMRKMLNPLLIKQVLDPFKTEGTFDVDVTVTKLPAMPEKFDLEVRFRDATATFAGHLDEETRRRYGFEYPLRRGSGIIRYESNLVNSHGLHDRFELLDTRGFRPIIGADADDPQEVEVKVKADATFYMVPVENPAVHTNVSIEVENLPIDQRLEDAFRRSGLEVPYAGLNLKGWVRRLAIDIRADGWKENAPIATYTADLEGCSMRFDAFPLGVDDITGRIVKFDRDPDGSADSIVELRGMLGQIEGGGHIGASGIVRIAPDGSRHRAIQIHTDDLPLGPALMRAFENSAIADSPLLDVWRDLRPHGRVGSEIDIVDDKVALKVLLAGDAHLGGLRGVDLPITHLKGELLIADNKVMIGNPDGIDGISAKLGDVSLWLGGSLDDTGRVKLTATARNVELTEPIHRLVEQVAPRGGEILRSLGLQANSRAHILIGVERTDSDAVPRINAEFTELSVHAQFAGVPLTVMGGSVKLDDEWVAAENLQVTLQDATVNVRSFRIPRALDGPGRIVLNATDLHPDKHLRKILGSEFGRTVGPNIRIDLTDFGIEFNRGDESIVLNGRVDLRRSQLTEEQTHRLEPTGLLGFSPITVQLPKRPGDAIEVRGVLEFEGVNMNLPVPIYDLSGELRISKGVIREGLEFEGMVANASATAFGRRFTNADMAVEYGPVLLRMHEMVGEFYGGEIVGAVAVHFEEPGGFDVYLQVKDASLSELLKEEGIIEDEYSGSIDCTLQLESLSNEVRHMRGKAQFRIKEGSLLQVPGLRMVLGVLGRVAPFGESPRFKTAAIDIKIRGEALEVERLQLSTAVNDIFGYGRMTIYGDLDLLVFPQVTKAIDLPRFLDVPVLSAIGNAWFKNVNEIRIEGTMSSPVLRRRVLPILTRAPKPFTQSPHANYPRRARPRVLPK